MLVNAKINHLTNRAEALEMQAETFQEQRIIGTLLYAAQDPDVKVVITKHGERIVEFCFGVQSEDS